MSGVRRLRLRRGRAADLQALQALEALFPGDRMSLRALRRNLASPTAEFLVLQDRGRLAGAALLLFRRGSRRARLYSLVVDPAYRGQGLGARLVRAAERRAAARGADRLGLEVRADNAAARALYARLRYAERSRLPGYYEDGTDGLRLEKPLRVQVTARRAGR